MIHVDVSRAEFGSGYKIEVSIDGSPFVEHWHLSARGSSQVDRDASAKSDARIYAAGIKFGGSDVRLTAFGADVYVPDMSTILVNQHKTS